jgi:hypothetical protein
MSILFLLEYLLRDWPKLYIFVNDTDQDAYHEGSPKRLLSTKKSTVSTVMYCHYTKYVIVSWAGSHFSFQMVYWMEKSSDNKNSSILCPLYQFLGRNHISREKRILIRDSHMS